jgi:hypothetical protein
MSKSLKVSKLANPRSKIWREIFGDQLDTCVCVIVIREVERYTRVRGEEEWEYERRMFAYCEEVV